MKLIRIGAMERCVVVCLAILATSALARGQHTIDWHTIDGGGVMNSAGGTFALSGTIGQSDAVPAPESMTGGAFELVGGFWPGATVPGCACLGDMNVDGQRNGRDIQLFVDCLLDGGSCQCADIDGLSGVTLEDADAFVADLLSSSDCQ